MKIQREDKNQNQTSDNLTNSTFFWKDMTGRKSAERITRNKTAWTTWSHTKRETLKAPRTSRPNQGSDPQSPSKRLQERTTNREAAKALPQEMANILIHLRCHAKCAERQEEHHDICQ